jgi:hypothetical protein
MLVELQEVSAQCDQGAYCNGTVQCEGLQYRFTYKQYKYSQGGGIKSIYSRTQGGCFNWLCIISWKDQGFGSGDRVLHMRTPTSAVTSESHSLSAATPATFMKHTCTRQGIDQS